MLTEEEKRRQESEQFMRNANRFVIEEMRSRRQAKEKDDDDIEIDDERSNIVRKITAERQLKMIEDNKNAQLAAELADQEAEEYAWEQERKRIDEEYANDPEMHIHEQEDIVEMFTTYEPESGGYSDVWEVAKKDKEFEQALKDTISVRIQEKGRDENDWRSYEEVGNQFRERIQALKENPDLKIEFDREDAIMRIEVKKIREVYGDNIYFNKGLHRSEPASNRQIQDKFIEDYPDVVQDFGGQGYVEAVEEINKRQKETQIESGFPRTDYEIYSDAGDNARKRNALREMAIQRGQNPETID